MKKRTGKLTALALSGVMALSLCACAGGTAATVAPTAAPTPAPAQSTAPTPAPAQSAVPTPAPTPEPTPAPAEGVTYTNFGLKLTIPEEYDELVSVHMETYSTERMFEVSERASIEAGQKDHPGEDWGDGFLVGIGSVGVERMQEMSCGGMEGACFFATDGTDYYLAYYPTDVRLVREGEYTEADIQQWSKLNEWAGTLQETFREENGLESFQVGNTDLEMYLNRIRYEMGDVYCLSSLDYGMELSPLGHPESARFADRLLEGAALEWVEEPQVPDGEYTILVFPDDNVRFDFFSGDPNLVRETYWDYETFYRLQYRDGNKNAHEIVQEWAAKLAEPVG